MSDTSSIQSAPVTVSKYYEPHSLDLTLRNGSGGALVHGQEVFISANNSVNKRVSGTTYPVGVVKVGGANGKDVTIATSFQRDMKAKAGELLTFGMFVRPSGVMDASGRPTYVEADAGEFAMAVVIQGAANAGEARLGVLRVPIQIA